MVERVFSFIFAALAGAALLLFAVGFSALDTEPGLARGVVVILLFAEWLLILALLAHRAAVRARR